MKLNWSLRLFLWAHTFPLTPASRFVRMLYEIQGVLYRWWHKIDDPDQHPF